MKTNPCFLPSSSASLRSILVLAVAAGVALPNVAQTAAHHTTPAATAHHTTSAAGGCVKLPEMAASIPALPASAPCAKALYTITRTPDIKLDYISPLVSPAVRESIDQKAQTFSLIYIDTIAGTGALVHPGMYVTVKYTGYFTDGKKFDSSDDHPNKDPITFQYGEHHVIEGWDTGYEGMHVGGKRRIVIPYQLAYGDAGRPPIPPKATLVFDVEVVGQSDKAPEPPASARPPMTPRPMPHPATPPPAGSSAPASSTAPAAKTPPPASTSTPPNSTAPKH